MQDITAEEIDLIIVATVTPDHAISNSSMSGSRTTRSETAAAMDISAACAGFMYGLSYSEAIC